MSNVTAISRAAALVNASAALAAEVNPDTISELIEARDEAESRAHKLGNRIMAIGALDTHPEWVVTDDPKYPTLWHLLMAAYTDAPDEKERELRLRIANLRMSYLIPGGKKIALTCFRCTLDRPLCQCCDKRLNVDHECRCNVIDDPADREVFDDR